MCMGGWLPASSAPRRERYADHTNSGYVAVLSERRAARAAVETGAPFVAQRAPAARDQGSSGAARPRTGRVRRSKSAPATPEASDPASTPILA